jgi:hypothetical protein
MTRIALLFALLAPLTPALAADSLGTEPHPKARLMRDTGIVVAVPGMVLGTASLGFAGLAASHAHTCDSDRGCMGVAIAGLASVGSATLAAPFLATGIGLWATGNKRLKANRAATTAQLGVSPLRQGAMGQVVVRF